MNWWLAKAKHIEEVADVAQEFKDSFGALPQPVENLLYLVRIKFLAMRAKLSPISTQESKLC
jgi:transcription-repair coupling factor (superfamily II helicase)